MQGQERSSVPEIDIEIVDSGDHSSEVFVVNGNTAAAGHLTIQWHVSIKHWD